MSSRASVYAAGLIIRDLPPASSWRNQEDLPAYLERNGLVAIADIDTRRLTRHLAHQGRPERLHPGGRDRRESRAGRREGRALDGGAGPREGGERDQGLRLERKPLGAG